MRGYGERGLEACARSLKLSPDRVSRAYASGFLGYVHVEGGEAVAAIPLLELAVEEIAHFGFAQWHGMFTSALADACRLAGDAAKAQSLARRGLEIVQAPATGSASATPSVSSLGLL